MQSNVKAAPPKRRGRKPILPKMNNSERGKYYRQKYREYEASLVQSVASLHQQLDELQATRDQLQTRQQHAKDQWIPAHSFAAVLYQYLQSIVKTSLSKPDLERWKQILSERHDAPSATLLQILHRWEQAIQFHTLLYFDLESFQMHGTPDAPVISTTGVYYTLLSEHAVARMVPQSHHDIRLRRTLVGKQVSYPTTTNFYLQMDGSLAYAATKTEYTHGLWLAFRDLHLALWLTTFVTPKSQKQHHDHDAHRSSEPHSSSTALPVITEILTAANEYLPPLESMRISYILS